MADKKRSLGRIRTLAKEIESILDQFDDNSHLEKELAKKKQLEELKTQFKKLQHQIRALS